MVTQPLKPVQPDWPCRMAREVTAMEVLVQPIAIEQSRCTLNDDGATWIRIGGAFFNNSLPAEPPTDQTNDIQAYISLRRNFNSTDPGNVMTIEALFHGAKMRLFTIGCCNDRRR